MEATHQASNANPPPSRTRRTSASQKVRSTQTAAPDTVTRRSPLTSQANSAAKTHSAAAVADHSTSGDRRRRTSIASRDNQSVRSYITAPSPPDDVDASPDVPKVTISPRGTTASHHTQTLSRKTKRALATMNRTNFIDIPRDGAIRESFMIDPHMPSSLSAPEKATPNLQLETWNGEIDVDVYLVGKPEDATVNSTPTRIKIKTDSLAPVFCRFHTPTLPRPPILVDLSAPSCDFIAIHIPRSFRGKMTFTGPSKGMDERVMLSKAVSQSASLIRETVGDDAFRTRNYFVRRFGDPADTTEEGIVSPGAGLEESGQDVLNVESEVRCGSLRVQYDDEMDLDRWRYKYQTLKNRS